MDILEELQKLPRTTYGRNSLVQHVHADTPDLQTLTTTINMADKTGFILFFPLARMVWGKLGAAKCSAGDCQIWAAMLFDWNLPGPMEDLGYGNGIYGNAIAMLG